MSKTGRFGSAAQQCFCISEMTEHDLLEVVEIEEACNLSRWGWDAYHAELTERRATLMLVARRSVREKTKDHHQIIGFIAARLVAEREVHINNVAVRHDSRRSGAGSLLVATALGAARQRGAREAFLEVRASNIPARKLYERQGFHVTGRRRNYYTQPAEDALLMSLTLRKTCA